ncbi:IgGFc-binding protein-like [Alosa sapidissima]|uniref:IgGFc-binding protein-like n=1 Tax=Alosa sapidissima TaxID=34773 RepID=UPI001C0A5252|nr:IgGFc-binding protein-like [Alosa sapidissima]
MVWVNDKVWNLPVTLAFSQKEITLRQSGLSVILWTDFGLTVEYDWKQYVKVTVPSSFMGRVGGLCGNFDNNKNNDLINPDGSVANSIEALGKSWRVPNQRDEQDCKDECTGDCGGCSWWRRGKADVFCGVMTPILNFQFRDCHAVIEPHIFFDMCKFDYCRGGEMKNYICDILGVYTDACQRAGVKVYDWRRLAHCPSPACPEHSHFEYCGNACPATCEDPSAPSSCKTPCVQTCTCDEGYFRSGNRCIRKEECGCQYNELYLQPRQSIWADECTQKITCNSGRITSEKKTCGLGEECKVKNGINSCQAVKSAVCTISGDPHYNTFDHVKYDFMGTCTYTAAEGCHLDGTDLTPFTVVVENEKWYAMSNDPKVSVAKLVAVTVYGNTIILRKNQKGLVWVNGAIMNLPVNLNEGQVVVQQIGSNDVISIDFGLKVTYDLVYHVTVTVPGTYADKTCGLCGNINGKTDDEFQLPDGKITKDVTAFGSSWKVGVPGVVCENGCEGDNCPKCPASERPKIESECSIITDPKGPFAACHDVIEPASYYRDCVYDVCVAEGIQMLCHSINAYVIDCQDMGVKVLNWRTPSLCPLTCPTNSHYSICASACKTPCPGLTSVTCADVCAEGCACNTGYFFNGTGCVPEDECSCYINGKTLKIGETVVADDCTVKYFCPKSGHGHMKSMSCTFDEMCGVQNGIRGCYPKQCIMGNNGVFTTFNGRVGDVQDSGMYDLVKICDDTIAEGWFRIMMDLQTCLQTGQMTAVGIIAFFDDVSVVVNSNFETLVNGKKATLPIQMQNGVSIQITDDLLVIEKMSAVVVSYSLSWQITVTVSDSVARNVCAACGKFSEDPAQATFAKSSIQNYLNGYRSPIFNFCPQ